MPATPAYSELAIINTAMIVCGWLFLWRFIRSRNLDQLKVRDFKGSVYRDAAVNSKLSELRFHMDACKAKIYQFHNGGVFFNGHSIKKMSLTHLQLRSDAKAPDINALQMLPTSLFPNMMSRFLSNKGIIVWDAKTAPDVFIRTRHEDEGLLTVMLCGIYHSETDALIGFISLNWTKERAHELDEPALIDFAAELGTILGRDDD